MTPQSGIRSTRLYTRKIKTSRRCSSGLTKSPNAATPPGVLHPSGYLEVLSSLHNRTSGYFQVALNLAILDHDISTDLQITRETGMPYDAGVISYRNTVGDSDAAIDSSVAVDLRIAGDFGVAKYLSVTTEYWAIGDLDPAANQATVDFDAIFEYCTIPDRDPAVKATDLGVAAKADVVGDLDPAATDLYVVGNSDMAIDPEIAGDSGIARDFDLVGDPDAAIPPEIAGDSGIARDSDAVGNSDMAIDPGKRTHIHRLVDLRPFRDPATTVWMAVICDTILGHWRSQKLRSQQDSFALAYSSSRSHLTLLWFGFLGARRL